MAHDSSRQQTMVNWVPEATVVNGRQLVLPRFVQDRTLAAWVMVGVAADAELGAMRAPAVAAIAVSDARANLVVLMGVSCSVVEPLVRLSEE